MSFVFYFKLLLIKLISGNFIWKVSVYDKTDEQMMIQIAQFLGYAVCHTKGFPLEFWSAGSTEASTPM